LAISSSTREAGAAKLDLIDVVDARVMNMKATLAGAFGDVAQGVEAIVARSGSA
jgi:hypothetical protein